MSKFEIFLKRIFITIFNEMPFNRQKADENFKEIKAIYTDNLKGNDNGYHK